MTMDPQNLRGNLKDFRFPDLLVYLHKLEANGILSVTDGPMTRQIFFRAGLPTAARSNVPAERLGALLLGGRVVTPEQYAKARRVQKESRSTIASALLALEGVSRHDLFVWTRRQFVGILLSLFSLKEAEYGFDENELAGDRYCFEVDFPALLALGVRSIKNATLLREMLGDLAQVPAPTNRFPEHRRIAFNADELPVIRRIDGARSTAQIVESSGGEPMAALKTLLVFRYLGFITMTVDFREEEMAETAAWDKAKAAPVASLDVEAAIAGDDFLVCPAVIPLSHSGVAGTSAPAEEEPQSEGPTAPEAASNGSLAAQVKSLRADKGGWLDTLIGEADRAPEERGNSRVVMASKIPGVDQADEHPWAIGASGADASKPPPAAAPPVATTPADTPSGRGFPWAFTTVVLLAALAVSLVAFTPWGADIRSRLFAQDDRQTSALSVSAPLRESVSTQSGAEAESAAAPPPVEQKEIPPQPAPPLAVNDANPPETETPKASPDHEKVPETPSEAPVLAAVGEMAPPMPGKREVPAEPDPSVAAPSESVATQPPAPEPVVDLARVLDLTHETGDDFVRVEVIVDRPIGHGKYALPEQNMVYLSLRKTRLPRSFQSTSFRIDSDLVRNVRIAQFDEDTARLVLSCRGLPRVSVFSRDNPHRVVLLVTPQ